MKEIEKEKKENKKKKKNNKKYKIGEKRVDEGMRGYKIRRTILCG